MSHSGLDAPCLQSVLPSSAGDATYLILKEPTMLNLRDFLASCDLTSYPSARLPAATSPIAKHRLAMQVSLEAREMLAAINLTPANFASQVSKIKSNDTVNFSAGSYKVSDSQKSALQQANSLVGVKGQTTLDFTGSAAVQILEFSGQKNGKVDGINFMNGAVQAQDSDGFVVSNSSFSGYNGKQLNKNQSLVTFVKSSNAKILSNSVDWENSSTNLRAFAVRGGSKNNSVSNNKVSGKLKQALVFNDVTGGKVAGNVFERAKNTPRIGTNGDKGAGNHPLGEDHGIYLLNTANVNVLKNKTSGWSIKGSGFGLKIKDVANINIDGNTFGSGIVGAVNEKKSGRLGLKNISITNNLILRGGIQILTKNKVADVTTKNNTIRSGNISIDNPATNLLQLAKEK
jgi:hypothetical protein